MAELGEHLLTISLWGWGEPLLHPQLPLILRAAQKHNVASLLSTNGQNLDDERIIEALIEYPPTFLIVAIDGLTDETNTEFRVGAKLEPILAGVRRLAEIKQKRGLKLPVLNMRYIVMRHNEHEMPQLQDFATRHYFDLLSIRTLSPFDTESPDRIHQPFVPAQDNFRAYDYQDDTRVRRNDFICMHPFWFPTVFADGTVVACEQDFNAKQSLGVLSEQVSFADLWYSERAMSIRKIIRDTPETQSFCHNCPYTDRQSSDCNIQALALNKGVTYPLVLSK